MIPEPFLSWLQTLLVLVRDNDEKALFLLLLIEEAGVPLPAPGDIVIMLAGYRASMGEMGVMEAAIAVTLAVQFGSVILYTISRRFGHTVLFKYGRLVHLDQAKLSKVEGWIQRHGAIMVLVGRLTPGLRTPTSIMAGAFEIPLYKFMFFTTIAALTWSGFWLASGYFFGKKLVPVVKYFHYSGYVLFGAAIVVVVVLLLRKRQGDARRRVASGGSDPTP